LPVKDRYFVVGLTATWEKAKRRGIYRHRLQVVIIVDSMAVVVEP